MPHGGRLGNGNENLAEGMPKRNRGASLKADSNTIELGKQLQKDLAKSFGKKPHLVILNVSRRRIDANRQKLNRSYHSHRFSLSEIDYFKSIFTHLMVVGSSFGKKSLFLQENPATLV